MQLKYLWSGLALFAFAGSAPAAVILAFNDGDALPTTANVPAGGFFNVNVTATSTLDTSVPPALTQIDGIGYFLRASTSGAIQFNSRDVAAGSFFDFVASTSPPVELLSSTVNSSANLGAINSGGGATSGTALPVSVLHLSVPLGTPAGIYTLSFASPTYTGAGPSYTNNPIPGTNTVSYTVVVPEPATAAIVSLIGSTAGMSRRRRRIG